MNKLKVFFAVLLTVVTLTHSKPSQAAVSIFTGGATAIVGLKVIAVGVVGGLAGAAIVEKNCSGEDCLTALGPLFIGAAIAALGVLILDGEQVVKFQELDKKNATRIGVNEKERLSFNEELDQVNMLLEDVSYEMTRLENPTSQDSASAWNNVKEMVSPLTFEAMKKIAAQK